MDGREFLTVAKALVDSSAEACVECHEGAAYRSAVSRAYYAAYHYAVKILNGLGFTKLKHGQVTRYLQ